jgi:Na+/H+ antiporter NhaC
MKLQGKIFFAILGLFFFLSHGYCEEVKGDLFEINTPKVILRGIPSTIKVKETNIDRKVSYRLANSETNETLAEGYLLPKTENEISFSAHKSNGKYVLQFPNSKTKDMEFSIRTIPGWLTVLPPLLAILLALLSRQVILSLFVGVWAGTWILYGGPIIGILHAVDSYLIASVTKHEHATLLVFLLLFGGMVGVMSRSGGMMGLVKVLSPYATDSKRGQFVAWCMGILVFFDDYANTLLLGNTMRPVTDKLKISREKLAYIADSIAAPVASIGLVSTWIGYEVSLISGSLKQIGSDMDAYAVFLQSIPYNFYPLLALAFVLLVAFTRREFGPMHAAEVRASKGKLLSDTAMPLSNFDDEHLRPPQNKPHRWFNAAIPIAVVLSVTFFSLWVIGRKALIAQGNPLGTMSLFDLNLQKIGKIFGASDSFKALLYGSLSGCFVAMLFPLIQGILNLDQVVQAWTQGIKSMVIAVLILVLAWSISAICADIDTSGFMVAHLSDHLSLKLLPALVFFLSSLTAFATGTSWATMGILIPLAVPVAHKMSVLSALDPITTQNIFLATVSSVLAGAIFGDHCSPISDTTVMSSISSGCDHIDHVKTQLPYAFTVAGVAMIVGYVPVGFGLSPFISLAICLLVLYGILRFVGKKVEG